MDYIDLVEISWLQHLKTESIVNLEVSNMDKYKVIIEETLSKTVDIEANSYSDALKKVKEMYYNKEIVLSANDYFDTEFALL